MAFTFTIAGYDYKSYLDLPTLQITEGLEPRKDTCSFDVVIFNSDIPGVIPKPASGHTVEIAIGATDHFKGTIAAVNESPDVNPDVSRYECTCMDFTHRLDRKLIATERSEELAGDRIKALVIWIRTYISPFPFGVGGVADGFTVAKEEYDYEPMSSIIDSLAEACHYQWYVDFDKIIHFFAQEQFVSPLNASYGNILDWDSNLEIGDIILNEDATQIKNRVYVHGYSQKGSLEYHDGPYTATENQSFYKLYQEPWDWETTQVKVNDVARTVRLDPLDGASATIVGREDEAYVCLFNMGIRFPTSDLPAGGDQIDAYYYPSMPDRISMFEDPYSISFVARRESSSGVYEFTISVPDLRVDSSAPVQAMGEYILTRFAWPYRAGSFSTYTLSDWKAGQYFFLKSASRDIYDFEVYEKTGQKVDIRMYVQQVTKTFEEVRSNGGVTELVLETVEFANKPYSL